MKNNASLPVVPLMLATALAGCAAAPNVAVDTSLPRVQFASTDRPGTARTEETFEAADGTVLGYVAHRGSRNKGTALVYLHGIESHAGWFDGPANALCAEGYDVFCLDRRGSGVNRENRGLPSGYVAGFEILLADVHTFRERKLGDYKHCFIVGLSWGGKHALAVCLRYPEDFEGMVLITPGIAAKVDVTVCQKVGIFWDKSFDPKEPYPIPIHPEMFTGTQAYLDKIHADPLRLHYSSARFLWESHRLDGFLQDHARDNQLPILVFLAGKDRIIDNHKVLEMLIAGKPPALDVRLYADQTHSIQFDAPDRLVRDMCRWLQPRVVSQ